MRNRFVLTALAPLVLTFGASVAGCSQEVADGGASDDLTSNSALARQLSFQGRVFVRAGATDDEVLRQVRAQTQTAFGPLRESNVAVNSRELKDVDATTFKKREVQVVDVVGGGVKTPMTEVSYVYTDNAVVDASYAKKSTVSIALMSPGYQSQQSRILTECTSNDSHARDFASSAWYVFDPSRSSCQAAIQKEQAAIDADKQKLVDPKNEVPKSEVSRLYLPATAQLGADKTNKGESYPDYHRLYAGGVKKDTLVVGLVYGLIDHDNKEGPAADSGYGELMTNLDEVFQEHPFKLTKVGTGTSAEGGKLEEVTSFKLASGKTISTTFEDLVALHGRHPSKTLQSLDYAAQREVLLLAGAAIYRKWLTFERDVTVTLDGKTTQSKVEIIAYFGAESESTPHKFGIKNSDVFLYNGHSYIGFGPLDPSRFRKEDFPSSYQILFIDGCVSYNYYEKDYIPLKEGGTKNLDLITNGIEAPAWQSGYALGRFVSTLLREDKPASYRELLTAAEATDSLRVVDGELDNEFSPEKMKLTVEGR